MKRYLFFKDKNIFSKLVDGRAGEGNGWGWLAEGGEGKGEKWWSLTRTLQLNTQIDDTLSYEAIVDSSLTFTQLYIYVYVGEYIYIYFAFLFVSNKGQNSWTDQAQFLCCTSLHPRERLWMLKISKMWIHKEFIFVKFYKSTNSNIVWRENAYR